MPVLTNTMPVLTDTAMQVLKFRYLDEGETPSAMFRRVAKHVATAEKPALRKKWTDNFYYMMSNLKFLPNTPCLVNAGRNTNQLSACFVIPVPDSVEGIFDSIKAAAMVHKTGGGTGFSFSQLRPAGSTVTETRGIASGPVSFMKVFDAATGEMKQGGVRRGANMGMLRVDHPDILQFLDCKKKEGTLTNFNISVALTDKFMNAVQKGTTYALQSTQGTLWDKIPITYLDALFVWDIICERIWTNGEPGVVFIDTVNDLNPLKEYETIYATNPCGEEPLPDWGSCTLGSINLSKCCNSKGKLNKIELHKLVRWGVRFLDNVIDVTSYPLPEIEKEAFGKRRIGLGIMGLADLFIKMKMRYGSSDSVRLANDIGKIIKEESYKYSQTLGLEKGSAKMLKGLDRRNGTLTTIAPTGSLSLIAGCSSGCEPIFSFKYSKRCIEDEVEIEHPLNKLKKESYFVTAKDVTIAEHIEMQAVLQKHIDAGISKTINAKNDITPKIVSIALLDAWLKKCKSTTLYREGSRELEAQSEVKVITPSSALNKDVEIGNRPLRTQGTTIRIKTGRGKMYVTANNVDGKPFEVFLNIGKSGKDDTAYTEAIGRLISLSLRSGVEVEKIVDHLQYISGDTVAYDYQRPIRSVPDAIATVLDMLYSIKRDPNPDPPSMSCPDCESMNIRIGEGCVNCTDCGWSKCS